MKNLTLRELLTLVFNWSYHNDRRLYDNLDDHFSAHSCRSAIDYERKPFIQKHALSSQDEVFSALHLAIPMSDYHDALRFSWTFVHCLRNKERDYMYKSDQPHPYVSLRPMIRLHLQQLGTHGLDDWHKSKDYGKHSHFRWHIQNILSEEKSHHLRLLIENDTRCFQTLYMGTNDECNFKPILQYVLDNHVCPDIHRKSLEVPDFINPDYHNTRKVTRSGKIEGLWYLVYLTGSELMEVYDNLDRRKMGSYSKGSWDFVKAMGEDTRFYLFIT